MVGGCGTLLGMSGLRRIIAPRVAAAAGRFGPVVRRLADLCSNRLAGPRVARVLAPRSADRFTVVVHFAGDSASTYQLEQWLWPLEQLAKRTSVGILCRGARTAERVTELTTTPVRYGRSIDHLDAALGADSTLCVLYVNQSPMNFHALRHPRPAHVHLSHGESEKASMVTNQLKAYDEVLTAGHAARDRLTSQLIGFGPERTRDVGRPQLDQPRSTPQQWKDFLRSSERRHISGGPVLLWAPTWEGDSASMAYGTLPTSGMRIVEAAHAAGVRIIYRPHPRTGYVDRRFREADRELREHVRAVGGFVDETDSVSWQFDAADACLAEMSSVAFDWLSTTKPLALILPTDSRAEMLSGGLFDRVPSYEAEAAGGAVESLANLVSAGQGGISGEVEAAAQYYLGEVGQGAQVRRFVTAVTDIVRERKELLR